MDPLLITGMHRSGTSMVTRILNICGLYIGPENMMIPPGGDNPKGFWEHQKVMNINGGIIQTYGGSWNDPKPFPSYFWQKPEMDHFHREISDIVTKFRNTSKWWGFKDPRFCYTLPIWKFWIRDLKLLICLRDPLSVADSLIRRDRKLGIGDCLILWSRYMQTLLDFSARKDRIVVSYDSFFENPVKRVVVLLNRLGAAHDYSVDYGKVDEACATINNKLRHQDRKLEDRLDITNLRPVDIDWILDLYEEFARDDIFKKKQG